MQCHTNFDAKAVEKNILIRLEEARNRILTDHGSKPGLACPRSRPARAGPGDMGARLSRDPHVVCASVPLIASYGGPFSSKKEDQDPLAFITVHTCDLCNRTAQHVARQDLMAWHVLRV